MIAYRMTNSFLIWMLIPFALHALTKSAPQQRAALGLLVIAATAYNFHYGIRPLTLPQSNPSYLAATKIKAATPDNAWVGSLSIPVVYIPYFGHRKPLILRFTGAGKALTGRIWDILAAGDPVFVTSTRLDESKAFPPGLGLRGVSRRGSVVLFQITSIAQ